LTLRQLDWMALARRKEDWHHTSTLLAMLYNRGRDPKERALSPAEFDPYRPKPKPIKLSARELRQAFFGVPAPDLTKPQS